MQRRDASSVHDEVVAQCRNLGTHGAQRARRGMHVGGREDVEDPCGATRHRGQDQRPMADRLVTGSANDTAHQQWRVGAIHRNHASSAVAASVLSSRYFTMTGVCNESPCASPNAEVTRRAPGTTTAPSGMIKG